MRVSPYLVYGLKESSGKFFYVGQSSTYLARPYSHLGTSSQPLVREKVDEIGRENVEVEILEQVEKQTDLDNREKWWICHLFACKHPLVNINPIIAPKERSICPNLTRRKKGKEFDYDSIHHIVRVLRANAGMNQNQAAARAGVGLRFLKDLEQGKKTVRCDKVQQVLDFFGYKLWAKPTSEFRPEIDSVLECSEKRKPIKRRKNDSNC